MHPSLKEFRSTVEQLGKQLEAARAARDIVLALEEHEAGVSLVEIRTSPSGRKATVFAVQDGLEDIELDSPAFVAKLDALIRDELEALAMRVAFKTGPSPAAPPTPAAIPAPSPEPAKAEPAPAPAPAPVVGDDGEPDGFDAPVPTPEAKPVPAATKAAPPATKPPPAKAASPARSASLF